MIRGYPRTPSLRPGETLTLHVSTTSPRFRVAFYRQGASFEAVPGPSPALAGVDVPDGPPDQDWGWPAYRFAIPADWRTGAYVAILVEIDADGGEIVPDTTTSFGTSAKALFIVRPAQPGPPGTPLYKVSWATFAAYNGTGYGSVYAEAVWSREQPRPGFKTSWRRPGCGTGGLVMPGDAEDYYDTASRRQSFEHWDAPLIRWLESSGFAPDYCTDWDLHQDPALLAPYSLLLSVGHDEYWSDAMRAALDRHAARGGNIAFFSGDISGYRIHFTDGDTAFTTAKVIPPVKDSDRWEWDEWARFNPAARVTGTAFHAGGGWWDGKRETLGYTVQHADHWVFDGSGLADGDVFGDDEGMPLIGYEVDGVGFRRRGRHAVANGEVGTPPGFTILGLAELGPGWAAARRDAVATMGLYVTPQGGIVFQGATTDWPAVVPRNRHVAAVTRNVVERLRLPSARVVGPLPHVGGRMVAEVGREATFHVDLGPFDEDVESRWLVAGAVLLDTQGPVARIAMPAEVRFVTVSVELRRDGEPVAFGTRTILPLSEEEALKLEMLTAMREMVMPGEPSNPLVNPTTDPAERMRLVYSIRIPWVRDRAARVEAAAVRLMTSRDDDAS